MCSRLTSTAPSITAACARFEADEGRVRDFVHPRHVQHRALRVVGPLGKPQFDMAQRAGQAHARRSSRPAAAASRGGR